MAQFKWNGLSVGGYLNPDNWLDTEVAPGPADTWLIDGAGDAPLETGGIFFIQDNPIVDLYGPAAAPSLIDDPDPSLIPTAAPIVSPDIVVNGGSAVVGLILIDSTIAAATPLDVTGIAVMQANYTDTLAGTISVRPTAGAAYDANGDNGELDLQIFPIGSYDPGTFTRRDYTPTVTNTGTIEGGPGSGFNIGFVGATPELNNLDGILQVLGGDDAFVNDGVIALQDSSMQVQAGFFAGESQYNTFTNNGIISLGPANPTANPFNLNDVVPGSAYFDAEIDGKGLIALTGQGAAQAGAEFLGGVVGNTIAVADATASFFDAGFAPYTYSGAFDFADAAGTLSLPIELGEPFLPINGFRAGDQITVRDGGSDPVLAWDPSDNQLTIEDDFSGLLITQEVLTVDGSYQLGDFTAAATAAGITVTTDVLACFAEGTRILTPQGEVEVERLAVGDLVLTRAGAARPVVWTGSRTVRFDREPEPDLVRPVRIRAHALGPGRPRRDLFVSPDHALFVDGLLIPARLLINRRTISVARNLRRVTYHHIELPSHDVIIAEGVSAESFLDTGHRRAFAGEAGAGASDLLSTDADRAAQSCAAFAVDAARVEPIWRRFAGPSAGKAAALTPDPALRLVQEGRALTPSAVEGDVRRFDVRGGGAVRIVSRAMRPSDRRPWLDDRRRLGVQVRSIIAHGAASTELARDGAATGRGWWNDEPAGRWTNGDAELWLPEGARSLELAIGLLDMYPASRPDRRAAP